jgi:hypothetical protein
VAVGGRKSADEALALALASGLTVEGAAEQAGVSPRTAYRRRADPDFRQRVIEFRAEMVQRALGKLADGAAAAVDTLRKLLKAKSEHVKLGAARAMLELASRLRDTVELEQRFQDVENRLLEREMKVA